MTQKERQGRKDVKHLKATQDLCLRESIPSRNEQLFLIHTCSFPNIVKRPKTARAINRQYNMPLYPGSCIPRGDAALLKHISSLKASRFISPQPTKHQLPPFGCYTTSWHDCSFITFYVTSTEMVPCACLDLLTIHIFFHDLVDLHCSKTLSYKVHPESRNIGLLDGTSN